MILIITNKLDPHVDAVVSSLISRKVAFERLNTEDFPQKVRGEWHLDERVANGIFEIVDVGLVKLSEVRSIWYRRPEPPEVSSDLTTPQSRGFAKEESETFLKHLWEYLSDRFWLNYPLKIRQAESKLANLQLASQVGFRVPRTLITTIPESARRFYEACQGNVITKVMGRGQVEYMKDYYFTYTHKVAPEDLVQINSVRYAPTLFQEYIPKSVEIRVTVVKNKVFCCEIHSQDSQRTKDDWRRYDFEHVKHLPHTLPNETRGQCLEIVSKLELNFATIDLVLTSEGKYVFLELNPNGQWLWIEQLTGLPIGNAITEALISHDK